MDLKNQYLTAKYKLQGNGSRDVHLLKEPFRFLSRSRCVYSVPFFAQGGHHVLANRGVVFNNKNAHGSWSIRTESIGRDSICHVQPL